MNTTRTTLLSTIFAATLVMATSVSAITYDATAAINTAAPAGATFTATPGTLGFKSQAGYKFLGVNSNLNKAGAEIDVGESLTITFDIAQVVSELSLGLLFNWGDYGDPNEKALVTINSSWVYSLQATGDTTALWSGIIQPTVVSNAVVGLGAIWSLIDPFDGALVKSITLTPDASVKGSDFGLVGFKTTTAVPDSASTLSLLGLTLLAFAALRRRLS